jgi:hypothetical protein
VIRRDPRDARTVFFQDPDTHAWHTLRWTGLPPEGEVPSFSDARIRDLLSAARQAGLKPRTDAELLPLLLELIGAHIPVAARRSMPKAARAEHALEVTQAAAAAADRASARPVHPVDGVDDADALDDPDGVDDAGTPRSGRARAPRPANASKPASGDAAGPAGWAERARAAQRAVDADRRRRRREQAVATGPVSPPPRLGEAFRHRSVFLLADLPGAEDTDNEAGHDTDAPPVEHPETHPESAS